MPEATVGSGIHQPFNVHGDFPAPVTFNHIRVFNDLPDLCYITISQIIAVGIICQFCLIQYFSGRCPPYPMDIG
jgi:hypothetical protein